MKKSRGLAQELYLVRLAHQLKKGQILGAAGPSKELVQLFIALNKWLNRVFRLDNGDIYSAEDVAGYNEFDLVTEGNERKQKELIDLAKAIDHAIVTLEASRPRFRSPNRRKGLFTALYRVYIDLTGSAELSDDGPSIRFVVECARLIDPEIHIPTGHALRDQLVRDTRRDPSAEGQGTQHRRKFDQNDMIEIIGRWAGYERENSQAGEGQK